jgi:hypothetical protein
MRGASRTTGLILLLLLVACSDRRVLLDSAVVSDGRVDSGPDLSAGDLSTPDMTACVPEGKDLYDIEGENCCPGLIPAYAVMVQNQRCVLPLDTVFICIECGNGTCGPGENACNCPQDCAQAAGPLDLVIQDFNAWADMMPPVPSDPIHIELTLKLTNTSQSDITGVQLLGAFLSGATPPGNYVFMQSNQFSGTVPAGSVVIASFKKVQAQYPVLVPKCGGNVTFSALLLWIDCSQTRAIQVDPSPFTCAF